MDLTSAALRQCTALEPSELTKMPNSRLESLLPARRRASAYTSYGPVSLSVFLSASLGHKSELNG